MAITFYYYYYEKEAKKWFWYIGSKQKIYARSKGFDNQNECEKGAKKIRDEFESLLQITQLLSPPTTWV